MGSLTYRDVEKLFLSGYPLNKWNWPDVFDLLLQDVEDGIIVQSNVLKTTVNHPLLRKYPFKVSYQLMFLKKLIRKLEESQVDISDELYEVYCRLLAKDESLKMNENDIYYRHYMLGDQWISLKESGNLVSDGTTGLHTWQASMALAEWCLKNQNECLRHKKILELGSGVGLTGLACILGTRDAKIIKASHKGNEATVEDSRLSLCPANGERTKPNSFYPESFIFSDCHPSVLQLLCQNVNLNLKEENVSSEESRMCDRISNTAICVELDFQGTKVQVLDLPWEEMHEGSEDLVGIVGEIDYIFAADVVYDRSLFPQLVGTLKKLLNIAKPDGMSPCAILACTKRNPDTIKEFLDCLNTSGLKIVEEEAIISQHFLYETDPPVVIYTVTTNIN